MTKKAAVTQASIRRMIKAATEGGLTISSVEIMQDGRVRLITGYAPTVTTDAVAAPQPVEASKPNEKAGRPRRAAAR